MPTYNKLVRDKIPEIIIKNGKLPNTMILTEKAYKQELINKLQEEVTEFLRDNTIEELADILEVVFALAKVQRTSEEGLINIRNKKLEERGGFDKRIFLTEVRD